jgi:hypothetical protein
MTDGQLASVYWYQATICKPVTNFSFPCMEIFYRYLCFLLLQGTLSDERMHL